MSLRTFFSGGSIERRSDLRLDEGALRSAWTSPDTRFVAVWQSSCMIIDDSAALLRQHEFGAATLDEHGIYLGQYDGRHIFAVELPDELRETDPEAEHFDNFGILLGNLPEDEAALLAYAKGMIEWQRRHRYCGRCGTRNQSVDGGFVMACEICGTRSFPRIDPAIIVLTVHGERCLLGRQVSWPEGRFSTIAGFVEPGEALEDAVRREVKEETNIDAGRAVYLGSQPWPFPNAIMLGFHAEAESTDIQLNDGELAEAYWFSREELAAGNVALPPVQSIAFRLIESWFDQWEGEPLRSFGLSTDFRRKTHRPVESETAD